MMMMMMMMMMMIFNVLDMLKDISGSHLFGIFMRGLSICWSVMAASGNGQRQEHAESADLRQREFGPIGRSRVLES